jgi:hypothetical protein
MRYAVALRAMELVLVENCRVYYPKLSQMKRDKICISGVAASRLPSSTPKLVAGRPRGE